MTTVEKIEVMLAYENGEEIEYRCRNVGHAVYDPDWGVVTIPKWNWYKYSYRVKPKPEEMTLEEVCNELGRDIKIVKTKKGN